MDVSGVVSYVSRALLYVPHKLNHSFQPPVCGVNSADEFKEEEVKSFKHRKWYWTKHVHS